MPKTTACARFAGQHPWRGSSFVIALAACAPVKSGPPGSAPSLPFGAAHPQAQQLYFLVNNERAAHGLGGVGWNEQLGALAQGWSDHMAATGSFSHQNLNAILQDPAYAGFSALGENIISGSCGMSAAQMHQTWMNSASHRAHILGSYSAIGIGIACNGGTLYAEDFGR
jgi:uncharacterized protein YkwD